MSQSLLAFDTDHIKGYVFGTSKLKEIRGASSRLDYLNRVLTREKAESKAFGATTIYAHGGSALFLIDSDESEKQAEALGKAVQELYRKETGEGASITYAIQSIPYDGLEDIMTVEELDGHVTMQEVLKLLHLRLRLAKDSLQMSRSQQYNAQKDESEYVIAAPSHALLSHCKSCGINYAEKIRPELDDPGDQEGPYCPVCISKREEDKLVRDRLRKAREAFDSDRLNKAREELTSDRTLWGRILRTLYGPALTSLSSIPQRPEDFDAIRDPSSKKDYLGLIYADANGMGKAMEDKKNLKEVEEFAKKVDKAVFEAMGTAIKEHLSLQGEIFPFDILLVGGDDIVIVAPAQKALQIAHMLTKSFHDLMDDYTLSAGVVLAPVKYPFNLQYQLVDDTLKAAKTVGSENNASGSSSQEQERINFVVVTGNTSLSYSKVYAAMTNKKKEQEKFYATMRPYTMVELGWLLDQLRTGNQKRLGRTKLHQLREAILKLNRTTTILESLMLLSNWKEPERDFIKEMVKKFDARTPQQQRQETLFPWYLDGTASTINTRMYRTPLLDFVELHDFVSS